MKKYVEQNMFWATALALQIRRLVEYKTIKLWTPKPLIFLFQMKNQIDMNEQSQLFQSFESDLR